METTTGNAMHSFCWTENAGMLATAALEVLAAEPCAVGVTPEVDEALLDEVEVALAVLVVDVVFGLGSSLSPSRYSFSS